MRFAHTEPQRRLFSSTNFAAIFCIFISFITPSVSHAEPDRETKLVGQMAYAIGRANGLIPPAASFSDFCSKNSNLEKVFNGFKDTLLNRVAPSIGALNGLYFEFLAKRYGKDFSVKQEILMKQTIGEARAEIQAKLRFITTETEANQLCAGVLEQIKGRLYDPSDSIYVYFNNLQALSPEDFKIQKHLFDAVIQANKEALEKANGI